LRRWISQVDAENQGYILPGSKPISPEQQRIDELEKRIKELEEDGTLAKLSEKYFGEDVFSYVDKEK